MCLIVNRKYMGNPASGTYFLSNGIKRGKMINRSRQQINTIAQRNSAGGLDRAPYAHAHGGVFGRQGDNKQRPRHICRMYYIFCYMQLIMYYPPSK